MERLFETIETLTNLPGISGDEELVRDTILEMIEGNYETAAVDPLGSLIVTKKGAKTPKVKLMAEAHMDEVGFIVTAYASSGMLHFAPVGGIDPRVALGRRVYFPKEKIYGVIGYKAIHTLERDELQKVPGYDILCIDIGAKDQEEAEKTVALGTPVVFDSQFREFGDGKIKAKAIDDRAGCAMLVEMIRGNILYDTTFVFDVQEEVGLRGAAASSFRVAPDYAVVVESTTAADIGDAPEEKTVCNQGKGAVLSWIDTSTIYDRQLVKDAFQIAEKRNILAQPKRAVAGGNDAGVIHQSRGGVKTLAVSIPCRYLHSQASVVEKSDVINTYKMVEAWLEEMGAKE